MLSGASFAVHASDRIGLVGLNGAGKSTLLRLLVASHSDDPNDLPDEGLITRQRDLTIEYLSQEPVLDESRTIAEVLRTGLGAHGAAIEEVTALEASMASLSERELERALEKQAVLHQRIEQLGGWERDHEIHALSARLRLPPLDKLAGDLSGGEKRRVALARALLARPNLLALDEPTNHLDADTIAWLEGYLSAFTGALLLVTHDRTFLDRVSTRILELDRGQAYIYEGGYTRFLEQQALRFADESERERQRSTFVRRELDWIRRGPAARTTKQQARIDRFDAAVAQKPTAEDKRPDKMALRLPTGGRLGKTIMELRDVTQAMGERTLFEHLSLIMKPGDRIGVVGENGAGKTTLIRTILGELPPKAGEVVVGVNTRISYLDQGRAELVDTRTVLEEVSDGNDQVFLEDGPVHVRTFLRMMLFDDGFANTPIGTLSGGERNRVQLAKLLRKGGNLLILDEPTNDLDLVTLGVLEDALVEFPGCALIVSHDRWFLDKVATGILAFDNGLVTFYEGDYTSYAARRPIPNATVTASVTANANVTANVPAKSKVKLTFKEKHELENIEATLLAAETRADELKGVLGDPNIYKTRAAEVPALVAEHDAARADIERLYARWQELESRK